MKISYCVECGEKLTKLDETRYLCKLNGHHYFNNPRACVGMVLYQNGQFLAAERGGEPYKGRFDLPGGFVEFGEDPDVAIAREVKEETNLTISNAKLFYVKTHPYEHDTSLCDLIYFCDEWEGTIKAQDDVASLKWQPLSFIESEDFAWPYPGLVDNIMREANANGQ